MPNRGASRASGFINPADGLTYSGAVVAQVKTQPNQAALNAANNSLNPANQAANTGTTSGGLADKNGIGESGGLLAGGFLQALGPDAGNTNASALKAEDDKTPEMPAGCDTSQSDKYCVYTIQAGETLSSIAEKFPLKPGPESELTASEMLALSNKPDVVDEDDLSIGQKLRIPRGNAVLHTVTASSTLSDLASLYGVSVDEIVAANGITDPNAIGTGTELLIPDPKGYNPPAAPVLEDDEKSSSGSSGSSGGGSGSSGGGIVRGGPKSSAGFIWPVSGPLSSYFGPNHPLGIDIDLFNGHHSPIGAAAGGVVTFAGGNACCSYGYYVVIDHGNGFQTLYGHLSEIDVSVGEVVAQGEVIGISGVTGYSTGEHLHFEVHLNGNIVNPLTYLP
jgi:murein DD-endopeptidase MepM/ murein hydrolase activator NlpD